MALDWARKRQVTFVAIIVLLVGALGAGLFALWWYEEPSCSDGRQNQNEVGPDCGGPCPTLCESQAIAPQILWERIFRVTDNQYSLLAFIENQNRTAQARNVPYKFTIYDKDNVVLKVVTGSTFIPPNQQAAIFEGRVRLNEQPARITFSFTEDVTWEPTPEEAQRDQVEITDRTQTGLETSPRVSATLHNNAVNTLKKVEAVAIVYDSDDNAVGASRTFVTNLASDRQKTARFTWPEPFKTDTKVCKEPTDVMLVLDRSGSMNDDQQEPPQPLTDVKNAASFFLDSLTNKDKSGLVSFATDATVEQQLTNTYQSVKDTIQNLSIQEPESEQHTNIAAGINSAREELMSPRQTEDARGAIALLTDGVASRPQKAGQPDYAEEVALAAASSTRAAGLDLYVVGLGDGVNESFLQELAGTGDNYFFAPTSDQLASVYRNVTTRICEKGPTSVRIITRVLPQGS